MTVALDRTKENPWRLKTPPGTSEFTMHVSERDGKPALVCTVGSTVLYYDLRAVDDLHALTIPSVVGMASRKGSGGDSVSTFLPCSRS